MENQQVRRLLGLGPSSNSSCSFCQKFHYQVEVLIDGRNCYICNECVLICYDIVKGEVEASLAEIEKRSVSRIQGREPYKVVVTSIPSGDAPLDIRKEWVGLELPLRSVRAYNWNTYGLHPPRSRFGRFVAKLKGREMETYGYLVDAKGAVKVLEMKNKFAAQWWRDNTEGLLDDGGYLIFDRECCEERFD